MSMYDTERFIDDLLSILQENLKAEIDKINTDKGDEFIIYDIPKELYLRDPVTLDEVGADVFVSYSLQDNPQLPQEIYAGLALQVNVVILFNIFDGVENKDFNYKKLLRYQRALQQLSIRRFDKLRGYGKINVANISDVVVGDDGNILQSAGLVLSTTIGFSG